MTLTEPTTAAEESSPAPPLGDVEAMMELARAGRRRDSRTLRRMFENVTDR